MSFLNSTFKSTLIRVGTVDLHTVHGVLETEGGSTTPQQLVGALDKSSLKFVRFTMTNILGEFEVHLPKADPLIIMVFDSTGQFMPALIDQVTPSTQTY